MRAIRFDHTGGPEVLELADIPVPQPGAGQVRIRSEAIGLNCVDTYQRSGLYPVPLPSRIGVEAAGVVDAVGEGVTRFKAGDRAAYALGPPGSYAEQHVVSAERAVHLPAGVETRVAAASLLKGMTAEFLLHRCFPVKTGQTILIHAAAGGVGSIMVQWAKAIGATVIATVGSDDKAARARDLGADHVILYREQDVAAEVRRITGGAGVPVVYDSVGAATMEGSLSSLARRGVLVSFGNASGPAPPVDPRRLMAIGSAFLTRPTMGDYLATPDELDESAEALFRHIEAGTVKIEIGQVFPLAEAARAHREMESRATIGASLLIP